MESAEAEWQKYSLRDWIRGGISLVFAGPVEKVRILNIQRATCPLIESGDIGDTWEGFTREAYGRRMIREQEIRDAAETREHRRYYDGLGST